MHKIKSLKTIGIANRLTATAVLERGVPRIVTLGELDVKPLDKQALVISALPAREVLVRTLTVALKKEREIQSVLAFQAEPLLPYPIESAILDKMTVAKMGQETKVTLFAAKKEQLATHLEELRLQGIEPEAVSATQSALAAFGYAVLGNKEPLMIVYVEGNEATVVLAQENKVLGSYVTSSEQEAIDQAMAALTSADHLLEIGKTVLEPHFGFESETLHRYAIAIGLALTALPGPCEIINFRQGQFAFSAPWKRHSKSLMTYFALSFATALALLFCGKAYLSLQEDRLRERYSEIASIRDLNQQEIAVRLLSLEKELKTAPGSFPLQPDIPLVSDLLAWLTTHPAIAESVQLESLHYTLVKRPEIGKLREQYQVRVEIEFTSASPTVARALHDALIAENPFVNPKGEIKWNANRGKYSTGFFLKDKTFYPPGV